MEKKPGNGNWNAEKEAKKDAKQVKKGILNGYPFELLFTKFRICLANMWILCVFVASVFCSAFPRGFGAVLSPIWKPNRPRTIVITIVFARGNCSLKKLVF